MMKQLILAALMVFCLMPLSQAGFPSDVTILDKKQIAGLSDDKLTGCYMDALVEIQAERLFHATSGFSAKEFKDYKALLKYRMILLMEISRRKLALPRF